LKDQFVVLSAHYDHLGVAKRPKMEEGKMDSIYNGARDNAIGTTAVIDAAGYFVQHPPKRSVLFIAYTAEEIGEIGSKYFAAHPPVPLHQLVYNLNIDNASYNDTTIVTVIGLGRTSADEDIKKACAAYGLTALPDPDPKENFFDRSDNTNLAVKGIPAPTFSLGIRQMDAEINKRYHQLSDEVGNFNLSYAMKYINSFILAAKYIADNSTQPFWMKGDKYEAAWKILFKK
jgi:Zn-dependent M28 family amino/carboxypeptidase